MEPESLKDYLTRYLKRKHCSQIILADAAGVSVQLINKIYTGRQKTLSCQLAIALEKATEIKAETWLKVAMRHNLYIARIEQQCN